MKENNKYGQFLAEDQDLLDELSTLGPMQCQSTEERMSSIQIKSTLRGRKSMNDLDKSTSRYSLILIIFAMVQIVIAFCQFIFDSATSAHQWIALGLAIFMAILVCFIFKEFDPDKLLNQKT